MVNCPNITVKYPEITVELIGNNGNAFFILGTCLRAMEKAGINRYEREAFKDEATAGDYNHLLITCMKWFNVE